MSRSERLAAIVRDLDWIRSGLSENGVECGDLSVAADQINEIVLEMEREAIRATVPA